MAIDEHTNKLEVKSNGLIPSEIKVSPTGIRKQYFNTDLNHTIALLAGYDGENEHIAQVTADGKLAINNTPPTVLHYQVIRGTYDSVTPSAANVIFDNVGSSIDLSISGNPVRIRLQDSVSGSFGDYIDLPVSDVEIPMVTKELMIWCSVSGGSSTVQIVQWR